MSLSSKKCVPCRGDVSPLSPSDAEMLSRQVPLWSLASGGTRIRREFRFKDFKSALKFVLKVSKLAEEEGHHPDLSFGWGYCSVTFYTHKIGGLHENDFIMAARTDALLKEPAG